MTEDAGGQVKHVASRKHKVMMRLLPLFAVTGAILVIALVYMAYDFFSLRAQPCEAIFRQASLGLSTKIGFLRAEGEIAIGREPLVELTERAQMTALNLKTCCTVLDAGRLDAEQFLQCKAKARAYEAKLGEIVAVVGNAEEAHPKDVSKGDPTPASSLISGGASTTGAHGPSPNVPAGEMTSRVEEDIQAARQISQSFNREVKKVRQAQALETLKLTPPRNVDVAAHEKEPNNDGLNTNVVPLDHWISAAIGEPGDTDMFAFKTPPNQRDWIKIAIDNRSTTLEPRIELFNRDKVSLGSRHSTTPGANVEYRLVSGPDEAYQVRVTSYYGKSTGGYLIRVTALKAYDVHEPNDSILAARSITAGTEIQGQIMDGRDQDFFRVESPSGSQKIEVRLFNASATLRPRIDIFDASKNHVGERHSTTSGSDLIYSLAIKPGLAFNVRISDYYGDAAGDYRAQVTFSK